VGSFFFLVGNKIISVRERINILSWLHYVDD
jgi:hypothetical protein